MSGTMIGFLSAGSLSAAVTVIELNSSLTKPLAYRRSGILGWLSARVGLDLLATLVAFVVVLPLVDRTGTWSGGLGGGIVAGLGGPVLLRVQLATRKSGKEHSALGLGRHYGRLRKIIDEALDDHGAVAQSAWLTTVVMPKIVLLPLAEIEKFTCNYIRSADRFTDRDKDKHLKAISTACADQATDEDERKRVIAQHMLDIGGRRIVTEMINASKVSIAPGHAKQ
ncbi:hypothetical protein [Amycolatopsis sp. NPDC003676]